MTVTPEQLTAVSKANLESLIELSQKTFEGVEKLVALNLQISRTALEESVEHAKAVLAAKDPQEVLALQNALVQPAAEKAQAYSRQVYEIVSSTQAEFTKLAEAQVASFQDSLQSLFDTAAQNAPVGSENAVAMLKSAMSTANSVIENVQKAAKQATSTAEANLQALGQSAVAAAPKAARRTTTAA